MAPTTCNLIIRDCTQITQRISLSIATGCFLYKRVDKFVLKGSIGFVFETFRLEVILTLVHSHQILLLCYDRGVAQSQNFSV